MDNDIGLKLSGKGNYFKILAFPVESEIQRTIAPANGFNIFETYEEAQRALIKELWSRADSYFTEAKRWQETLKKHKVNHE